MRQFYALHAIIIVTILIGLTIYECKRNTLSVTYKLFFATILREVGSKLIATLDSAEPPTFS